MKKNLKQLIIAALAMMMALNFTPIVKANDNVGLADHNGMTTEREYEKEEKEHVGHEHVHSWIFCKIEWNTMSGTPRAYALYKCSECCYGCGFYSGYIPVNVTKTTTGCLTIYTAYVSAKDALDGHAHTSTYILRGHVTPLDYERMSRKDLNIEPISVIRP